MTHRPGFSTSSSPNRCRRRKLTSPRATNTITDPPGNSSGLWDTLTLMLTSSVKAAFCNSKARLESAILVSAMNLTSSISLLHSASCREGTESRASGPAVGAEEAAPGKPGTSPDSPECQHPARLLPLQCLHPFGQLQSESSPGSSGSPLYHRHPGEGR